MGEYLSVKEAAAKWGVSERRVNQFCAEGRIKGARKLGGVWAIPAEADKPSDPRRKKAPAAPTAAPARSTVLMPLMNTPFEPGRCTACIRAMEAGPGREIAWAEYYYFSGQPEKAIRAAEPFLTDEDLGLQLSACWIYAYANLSVGQIQRAKFALSQVQKALTAGAEKTPQLRAAEAVVAAGAAVLLHLPVPKDLPPTADFLPLLPPGPRAFALYIQAHYLYLQQEYGKSVGIVEATLAMGAEQYPISAIYLHLVAVMDYMSLRQPERARGHLLSAWDLARPDDLIEGFGEHHGLLGGMLEAVLKQDFPEDFKRIIAITYRFSSGWRRVHNPETGHDVADNLTTTEFAAAMLPARGWTNQEIGDHMNISPNTVKRYISQVLKKLDIEHHQDLKQHMLQ